MPSFAGTRSFAQFSALYEGMAQAPAGRGGDEVTVVILLPRAIRVYFATEPASRRQSFEGLQQTTSVAHSAMISSDQAEVTDLPDTS
jgi:hypothetical protein